MCITDKSWVCPDTYYTDPPEQDIDGDYYEEPNLLEEIKL